MQRVRSTGLAFVAASLLAAVLAPPGLAALPEFSGPFPKAFTSTSGSSFFESKSGTKITCLAGTDTGEVSGGKAGSDVLRFTGCETGGLPCENRGAGEIVTNQLVASLGYINAELKSVGLTLSAPPTGAPWVEFTCAGGAISVVLRGSVRGTITPHNKPVKPPKGHFVLKFAKAKGLEGTIGGTAETFKLSRTDNIFFSEVVEIKA
jgi:hypothetical protein